METLGTSMVQIKRSIGLAALPWNGCHFARFENRGSWGGYGWWMFFFPRKEKR